MKTAPAKLRQLLRAVADMAATAVMAACVLAVLIVLGWRTPALATNTTAEAGLTPSHSIKSVALTVTPAASEAFFFDDDDDDGSGDDDDDDCDDDDDGDGDDDDDGGSNSEDCGSLPVELVGFEAQVDGRSVLLRWQTASETNNAGFEIQRISKNEEAAWQVLGWVEGQGTTLDPYTYRLQVEALDPGRHVFRLKQIDFDGTFEYSPEVEVAIEMPEAYLVSPVYPNPFNPQASFSLGVKREQMVRVEVFNMLGQRVLELYQGVLPAGVTRTLTIDGSGLVSGTYMLRVVGETFVQAQTLTLVK